MGGICCPSYGCLKLYRVSSRAPVWGASFRGSSTPITGGTSFKSCPRVGGIAIGQTLRLDPTGFKSCPRVGGIRDPYLTDEVYASFKSCPRVGGISQQSAQRHISNVSSRAPVWGASHVILNGIHRALVSSRAPVWGASSGSPSTAPKCCRFQVVPPCGGHPFHDALVFAPLNVSSRAPVWGASSVISTDSFYDAFQVVPPCGGHPGGGNGMSAKEWFQVVPPCGGHLSYVSPTF